MLFIGTTSGVIGDSPMPAKPGSPVISSVMQVHGTVGAPFNYTVWATHMMEADKPVKFTADVLPAGLSLKTTAAAGGSPAIGQITGTLQGDPRTITLTVSAINAAGTGTAPITLIIGAGGSGRGFFTTYKDENGVWWFKDPAGNKVISKAMDNYGIGAYRPLPNWANYYDYVNAIATFGTEAKVESTLAQLITSYNFNTIGAWSGAADGPIAGTSSTLWVTPVVQFGSNYQGKGDDAKLQNFPDPWADDWVPFVNAFAESSCAQSSSDPWVVGNYIDNEIYWGYAWDPAIPGQNTQFVAGTQLLLRFIGGTSTSKGHFVALDFLQSKYHKEIKELNAAWNTNYTGWEQVGASDFRCKDGIPPRALYDDCNTFAGMAAQKYFSTISAALKAADPNHLNLGCRFASGAPGEPGSYPLPAVVTEEAQYVDVISFNCYGNQPTTDIRWYVAHEPAAYPRPVMIGEFTFRSKQNNSHAGNGGNSGPIVATQTERAIDFTSYVKAGMAHPYLIGYSWFGATDEPTGAQGNNYGVWDLAGKPYSLLAKQMTETNAQAEALHAAAKGD